jgi:hypothetical protein
MSRAPTDPACYGLSAVPGSIGEQILKGATPQQLAAIKALMSFRPVSPSCQDSVAELVCRTSDDAVQSLAVEVKSLDLAPGPRADTKSTQTS